MKSNYEERRQARLEAFKNLAAKNESLSVTLYDHAKHMASFIPFGQPILVGHHSEKRDRNYRSKIHNTFGRSFKASDKAKYYEGRAETIEANHAISSDDPNSIERLQEKLAVLEKNQELMKNCNKIIKYKKYSDAEKVEKLKLLGLSEKTALEVLVPHYGRLGIPSFKLTNNNATIRNTKLRIEHLTKLSQLKTYEKEIHGVKMVVSAEDNRVQLFFPGKPSEEVRKELKGSGFHWSPYVGAWMRQISNYAVYCAEKILNNLNEIK